MPNPRQRALLALRPPDTDDETLRRGYRVGDLRNEVVGDQGADGEGQSRTSADVYVFERIGGWFGVTADDFVRDVAALDVDHIDLHLNSPGGEAFEGIAIANVLRQHKADVTVWVDGIAASAASVIAMAGDEIVMSIGAQFMIHDASLVTMGNAEELRKDAEVVDKASDSIASTYAAKAGGTAAQWRAVMQAETWYTAEEAVAAGLADRVATDQDKGKASGQQVVPGGTSSFWDLWDSLGAADRHADALRAMYGKSGRAEAPAPKTPAATASGSTHKERSSAVPFTEEHLATMRTKLGLAADADEDQIVATVTEVMDKFVEDDGPPAGTVLVSASVLEDLKMQAAQGVEARKQQQAERRQQLVDAAVRDGRIRPADRAGWLNDLEKDPERKEATLASLTPGLVPLEEIGTASNDASSDTDADALYRQVFGEDAKEASRG
jgi:ATP-dependent protease ClpP protease subunit